jgi:hypothetical protein
MAVQRWSDSFSIASHGTTVETIFTSLIRWRALARAPEVASLKAFATNPDECRHSVRISHGAVRNAG